MTASRLRVTPGMATIKEMSGVPSPTPGSAEGTENTDSQSKIPLAGHTPGSAEGEDLPELTHEAAGNEAGHNLGHENAA